MVAEIALNAIGSALAVVLMYVHSHAAFGNPVPRWLSTAVCVRDHKRDSSKPHKNDYQIHPMAAEKTILQNVYTTVSL